MPKFNIIVFMASLSCTPTFKNQRVSENSPRPLPAAQGTSPPLTHSSASPIASTPSPGTSGAINDSNGSGGQKGLFEGRFNNNGRYWINVPQDNLPSQKSHGLLVLLHGSSASNYREFIGDMASVATTHNLIPISVLAPNGSGWNEGNQGTNAQFLDDLIQKELLPKYNVDKRNIFFSGQSSGGGFLGSDFVSRHGSHYQGGAFLLCGAAPPKQFTASDEMKAKFKMHFEITSGDPIWPESYRQAVQAYRSAGIQLTTDESKRGGHCQFDQAAVIGQYIGGMLTR